MSAFNIPNWREQEVSGKVELPPELPHDLIELPSIDATAPKRLQYMAKGGRWSFDRHLQNLPRHGVGSFTGPSTLPFWLDWRRGRTPLSSIISCEKQH